MPTVSLQACIDYAKARLANATSPWSKVTGPAAALICTLDRVGWKVASATKLITETGRVLDLQIDPPVIIGRLMEAAVRKWRWSNVSATHPSIGNNGANFDPIYKLLASKRNDEGWNPRLRGALRSVIPNRQFCQARCYQAGWVAQIGVQPGDIPCKFGLVLSGNQPLQI